MGSSSERAVRVAAFGDDGDIARSDGTVAAASSGWGGELLRVPVMEDVVDAAVSMLRG